MVDIARAYHEAKSLPDEALNRELSQPTGMIPGYLIMAELEDRKALRAGGGAMGGKRMSMKDELLQGLQSPQNSPDMPLATYASGGLVDALNPFFAQMQARDPMVRAAQMQEQMTKMNHGYMPLNPPATPAAPGSPMVLGVPTPAGTPSTPFHYGSGGITDLLKEMG